MTCPDQFPDGRFACQLDVGHVGAHREGRVAWSGSGSQVADRHDSTSGGEH